MPGVKEAASVAMLLNGLVVPAGPLSSFFNEKEKVEETGDVTITAEW